MRTTARALAFSAAITAGGCAAILGVEELERDTRGADDGGISDGGADAVVVACGGIVCSGPHRACIDDTCACVVGYAEENGACVFRGGPRDPTFENTPKAWVLAGGAAIDPAGVGANGTRGVATVPTGASVRQSFDMPPYGSAEPLALLLVASTACGAPCNVTGYPDVVFGQRGSLGFGVGANGFATTRVCLGEAAYGPASELLLDVVAGGALTIDVAQYVPDPSCPPPGKVRNGDFEAVEGWTPTGEAQIVLGKGASDTRGGVLSPTSCNAAASLLGEVSVPAALPRPALTFRQRGPTSRLLDVLTATVPGRSSFGTETICLPEWSRGYSLPLPIALAPVGSGACLAAEFAVDDFAVVSSPTCPDSPFVLDGAFEDTSVMYWQPRAAGNTATARIDRGSGAARSGSGSLLLASNDCGGTASASQAITLPPSGAGGPAVSFWSRGVVTTGGRFTVAGKDQPVTSEYTRSTVCLPTGRAMRSYDLVFSIAVGGGTCSARIDVDDVVVGNDPSCASEK